MIPEAEILVVTDDGAFDVRFHEIYVDFYPDGSPLVTDRPEAHSGALILRPKGLEGFMAAMFWVDALAERGGKVPPLILPSIPGARQDRLNPVGDCLFTVKSIAREINMRNFPRVVTFDPHSDVGPALIDRCQVVHADTLFGSRGSGERPMRTLGGQFTYWDGIIAPDGGAGKRAGAVAQKLGLPLFQGTKKRNVETGKLEGFGIEDISSDINPRFSVEDYLKGVRLLVVDDICDGGGTFLGLADVIDEVYTLDLFVSHGIFSQGTEKLLAKFDKIYTTNSIPGDKTGVEVIDVIKHLLKEAS